MFKILYPDKKGPRTMNFDWKGWYKEKFKNSIKILNWNWGTA